MGQFLHFVSTFVAGFAVAFTMVWRLGLVTLAVAPVIAVAGGFYGYVLTGLTSKNREVYEDAGNLAEQVQICTTLKSFSLIKRFSYHEKLVLLCRNLILTISSWPNFGSFNGAVYRNVGW